MELIWQVCFRENRVIPSKLREARTLPNKAFIIEVFFCEKLLNLEKELHELISRKDFNIDYVNNLK